MQIRTNNKKKTFRICGNLIKPILPCLTFVLIVVSITRKPPTIYDGAVTNREAIITRASSFNENNSHHLFAIQAQPRHENPQLVLRGAITSTSIASKEIVDHETHNHEATTNDNKIEKIHSTSSSQPRNTTNTDMKTADINSLDPQNDNDAKCQDMLDQWEIKFDQRRQVRLDYANEMRSQRMIKNYRFDPFEAEFHCLPEERFGELSRYYAIGDGPKFVCGIDFIEKKNCLVYSIGSRNQIQFEQAVHTFLGCETHTFDPTLTEVFKGGSYATFHPWGLGLDNGTQTLLSGQHFVTMSLATIMKELGHEGRTLDILKIDCDGCEWTTMVPVFQDIAKGILKVNQIQIEVHLPEWPEVFDFFEEADKANMSIFHKETNHWGCGGFECVEYSFVKREFLRQVNSEVACNHRLNPTSDSRSCDGLMDDLFDRFAHTRAQRNELIKWGYGPNSTDHPFINYVFDPFESEALCFAKERFGSDPRNHDLGMGGRFTCGIEFIRKGTCHIFSYSTDGVKSFDRGVNERFGCLHELNSTEDIVGNNLVKIIETKSPSGHADIVHVEDSGTRRKSTVLSVFDGIAAGRIVVDQVLVKVKSNTNFGLFAEMFQRADRAKMLFVHKEYYHWDRKRRGMNMQHKSFNFLFVSESHLRFVNSQVVCENRI